MLSSSVDGSGFYDRVGKPSLCSLSKGATLNYGTISVGCKEIIEGYDLSGTEFNRKFDFVLSSKGITIGAVVVHLHHSRRSSQKRTNMTQARSMTSFLKCRRNRINLLKSIKMCEAIVAMYLFLHQ